jgi:predicted nucleotidyltransferase component of viral defense system
MTAQKGKNTAVSVRDRLLKLARQRGEDFQLILTRYGLERLLYRLSQSEHCNQFILKGAMLFSLWSTETHRPTRDVDLLGFGESDEATLQQIFSDLCQVPVEDDGLLFLADSIRVESIRDATEYGGVRVTLLGYLADARIPVQADIGFGDVVTPEPEQIEYPTLLEYPAPSLRAYPRETVVAEKYQALVNLGIANSRMKDFYDLWIMARQFDFDGVTLSQAIQNTFIRRQTSLPAQTPSGLDSSFYGDMQKNLQWNAFLRKGMLLSTSTPPSLEEVCRLLETFLMPPTQDPELYQTFNEWWQPGGPWKRRKMPG